MSDLMRACIIYGMQNSSSNIDDIFGKISVDTVRKYVISSAIEVNKIQFEKFSKLSFVGISCDEGSTRTIHNLDFVLECPLSGLQSYPCFTTTMKGGTANDYCESLAHGLFFISNNNINIGSITVDGNYVQLKALSFNWKNSLRNRYIDSKGILKHIIVNNCLCHRINNCYKKAYSKDDDLKTAVDYIRDVSRQCKENISDVLDVCPSVQLTRWVIDYDICTFIINHAQRIRKFLELDMDTLLKLQQVLSILKSLINIFENERTPHFKAFRILEEAIGAFESIEETNSFAQCIKEQLFSYTLGSKTSGIWMLSYILTPDGRNDFSMRINKRTLPAQKDYTSFFNPGKVKEPEDIVAITNAALEDFEVGDESNEETIDATGYLKPINTDETETEVINEEEEEINDPTYKSIDRLCLNPAQNYLSEILESWGIFRESKNKVIQKFNTFVQNPIDDLSSQTLESGDYFWENIKYKDPIWNTLSEIAMRLHCSPCSEATCERTISSQRLILTARRMNSKKQLLDARLTLLRGLNVK